MPKRCIRIFGPAIHHKKARIQKKMDTGTFLCFFTTYFKTAILPDTPEACSMLTM